MDYVASHCPRFATFRWLRIVGGLLLWACLFAGEVGHALAASSYPFSLTTERTADGHRVVARNQGPGPVSVRVSLVATVNVNPDRPLPAYDVVPAGSTRELFSVRALEPGRGYHFDLQSSWGLGDYNYAATPPVPPLCRLPFPEGRSFRLGQSPGGPVTTHDTPDSRFAVDIPMPEGTPVLAARDGLVIETETGQVAGGLRPELRDRANLVRILHADGSMAVYAHLAPGGVYVIPGQQVSAGNPLGLSGNTGYSSGPHLHFAVVHQASAGEGFAEVSLPFSFYVGDPPTPFSPRFGLQVLADYRRPQPVPALEPGLATAITQWRPGQGPIVLPEAGPVGWRHSLRAWSPWRWAGLLGMLTLLLWSLSRLRRGRRHPAQTTRRPAPADGIVLGLTDRDKLLIACGGDRAQSERLINFEYQWQAGLSADEAATRALARLVAGRTRSSC